jgi:hypothetical protein
MESIFFADGALGYQAAYMENPYIEVLNTFVDGELVFSRQCLFLDKGIIDSMENIK